MNFQGVRHAELAERIHKNPEQFYPLLTGKYLIGKPQPKEAICREILLHLGFTLIEITNLHSCDFDMVAFTKLSEGSTAEKVDDISADTLDNKKPRGLTSSSNSIPIDVHELDDASTRDRSPLSFSFGESVNSLASTTSLLRRIRPPQSSIGIPKDAERGSSGRERLTSLSLPSPRKMDSPRTAASSSDRDREEECPETTSTEDATPVEASPPEDDGLQFEFE